MNRSRAQVVLEAFVAVAAAALLLRIAPASVDYQMALQFLVVVFVLDLLDLSMPYGETMAVDSAMVVACLILAGPVTAALVSVIARVAVQFARRGTAQFERTLALLSRRLLVLAVCAWLLEVMQGGPSWMAEPYVQGLAVCAVFVLLEMVVAQVQAAPRLGERFSQLVRGNFSLQGPLLAAQVSVAVLSVITFGQMGIWGLAVMVLLVILMRESLALYLAIRQAYRATMEALVAVIEAQDPRRKGHAERVESLARSIALRLGIRGRELEYLGYAALLHDVDMLGLDLDVPDPDVAKHSGDTVSTVKFLSGVVPILQVCDGASDIASTSIQIRQAAAVVAVASDIDDRAYSPEVGQPARAVERVAEIVEAQTLKSVEDAARSVGHERAS
jgi:hypothetical protein